MPAVATPEDIAALEWLDLELRMVDARRPRVVDELARSVSVVPQASELNTRTERHRAR